MSVETSENSNDTEEFTSRNVGVLPNGSRVRRINQNTETKINYGNEVWTTAQTVRDVFQNHLDANTQQFVEELLAKILIPSTINIDTPQKATAFNEIILKLFTYKKVSALGYSKEVEERYRYFFTITLKQLTSLAEVKIRPELFGRYDYLDLGLIKKELAKVVETPPQIQFKIIDIESSKRINIEPFHYESWSRLFTNAYDVISTLLKKEIKIPESEAIQIASFVSSCAIQIKETLDSLNSTNEGTILLKRILTFKTYKNDTLLKVIGDFNTAIDKWCDPKKILKEDLVFISPKEVNYLGLAQDGKLGINEKLIMDFVPSQFASVVTHELVHILFNSSDYSKEFIIAMIELSNHFASKGKHTDK
ncbi:MAG: hypothetical protein WCK31_01620 [bacterium]